MCDGCRKHLLELYPIRATVGRSGAGPLQRLAQSLGLRHVRYQQPAGRAQTVDRSNPFFLFDNAVCISCARCVRACDDIQGTHALTMLHRGFESRPTAGGSALTGESAGFASSNCVSCGPA